MAARRSIPIAIIDDSRLVREALASILGASDDLRVVFAGDAIDDEALAALAEAAARTPAGDARTEDPAPLVLLLDVGLGDRDSLTVAIGLRRVAPAVRIIVMDLLPVHEDIRELVNAGVAAFVLKDASAEEFGRTIRAVAAGETVLPARMTESLFAQIIGSSDRAGRTELRDDARLTHRELQVIAIIGEGLSNKEIAQRLNIAADTVKSHVRNVMEKLAVHTRLQIAAYSHREREG